MSETVALGLYTIATIGVAAAGLLLVRAGIRNGRDAYRLRRQPLLLGIKTSDLEMLDSEPWPTSGRWPGPSHHPDEFFDEKRRAVYRSLALDKALGLSLSSEVTLLLSAAYLGYAFPPAIGRLLSSAKDSVPQGSRSGVLPDDAFWRALVVLGPTFATLLVIFAALVMRARSKSLRRLAAMYKDPGPLEPRAKLWVPPRARG